MTRTRQTISRLFLVMAVALATAVTVLVAPSAARADDDYQASTSWSRSGIVFGRVVLTGTSTPAVGVRVTIWTLGSKPRLVGSAWTGSNGRFVASVSSGGGNRYRVWVSGGGVAAGWMNSSGRVASGRPADVVNSGGVGTIEVAARFVSGTVVDARTSRPVAGVQVSARNAANRLLVLGRAYTSFDGTFKIPGVAASSVALMVDGRTLGRSSGWRSCGGTVETLWRDVECATGTGEVGWIWLPRR